MVIGRAVIVDRGTGAQLVRVLNVVAGVGLVAPIAGLGGADTATPTALLVTAGAALSTVGLLVPARPALRPAWVGESPPPRYA
ncbi:hypothetical protein Ade02nite_34310 [Paractinoplanes deccanensis]|uniref:MFS transporter n=1 Tax=Paractinoplanes deccanensis TaxID=113561 RepID=A0ABQ3Y4J9_9ACTN|nr:hypothetical protein [Actinoplanes deccanensis]GID74790.1 hypothetical protein Ade02nite_34310 [Actinoplanes deccanensis]